MALSAFALTKPQLRRKNYRLSRGYDTILWGHEYGANKVARGASKPIRDLTELFDPGYGGMVPTMEPDNFTCNQLGGNREPMVYMNAAGSNQPPDATLLNGRSRLATLGAPHIVNNDSLSLMCRLRPEIDTDAKLVNTYFSQNPFVGPQHTLNGSGQLVISVDDNKTAIIGRQYLIGPAYQRNASCVATLDSYVSNGDGTATATFTKNYVPVGAFAGNHNQLRIQAMVWESACLSTRTMLAPTYLGYWELRVWMPPGRGIWPAWWFIRNNAWPPEFDPIETFHEFDSEVNTVHSGKISFTSGHTWGQNSQIHQNYCTLDGTNVATFEMNWGYSVHDGYHTIGMEWNPNGVLGFTLDDVLAKSEQGKWVVHRQQGAPASNVVFPPTPAIACGEEQAFPHMVYNIAIGPILDAYRPDLISRFPAEMKIDYVRLYGRSMA